jgi:biopolymer transport protein ExbD
MEINMTPMIDVVFQLLIFFMTCSQVSEVNREPLELPKLAGGETPVASEFIVNIDRAGVIRASGIERSTEEIVAMYNAEVAAAEKGGGANVIVLRIDRRATCESVNELVTALVKQGLSRIRLAVETGG